MTICRNCGVELEEAMDACPLCHTPLGGERASRQEDVQTVSSYFLFTKEKEQKHSLQKVIWQVCTIILFSGMIATLLIDIIINQHITWSIFPVAMSLILFSYLSLFAFWHTRLLFQLLGGWGIATVLLVAVDFLMDQAPWATRLAIPFLFAVNLIIIGLIILIGFTSHKGLNLLAYSFVAIALLCMCIEGILSFYSLGIIHLEWSLIVAACLLPVTAALLFMYYRTRKNAHLQKIFHT